MSHIINGTPHSTTQSIPYSIPQGKAASATPLSMSQDENKMLTTLARLNPAEAKAYFAANKEKAASFTAASAEGAAKFALRAPEPTADANAVKVNEAAQASSNDPRMAGVSGSFTSEDLQDLMAMYDKACGDHQHTPGMNDVPGTAHDAATHTGHSH